MVTFLIYDDTNKCFIDNIVCANRVEANKWCDTLETLRGGIFIPVKFIDGIMQGRI